MNRDVVLGEWKRATKTLSAAELLAREDYPEDAFARAYYAILHAAKAALAVHDIFAESHSAVRGLFGQHLILTGAITCGFTANDLAREDGDSGDSTAS